MTLLHTDCNACVAMVYVLHFLLLQAVYVDSAWPCLLVFFLDLNRLFVTEFCVCSVSFTFVIGYENEWQVCMYIHVQVSSWCSVFIILWLAIYMGFFPWFSSRDLFIRTPWQGLPYILHPICLAGVVCLFPKAIFGVTGYHNTWNVLYMGLHMRSNNATHSHSHLFITTYGFITYAVG